MESGDPHAVEPIPHWGLRREGRKGVCDDDVGHELCHYAGDYGQEDGREEETGVVDGEVIEELTGRG